MILQLTSHVTAMSMSYTELNAIEIPLGSEAHAAAEIAYQKQSPPKRKHIYLNILAVQAVKQYLQWLSIPTDWQSCESYDPVIRQFMDVADIDVPGYGRLECRPVLPGDDEIMIPGEVQDDRIGYIAVQFNEALEAATLLGFAKIVSQDRVPLETLEPIEKLLEIIGTAPATLSPTEEVPATLLNWREPVSLSKWLDQQFNEFVVMGWQTLEEISNLIVPEARMELALQVRGARGSGVAPPIKRGKLIAFEKGHDQVALVVGLQEIDPPDTEILVEVYPTNDQVYLPKDLELMVLDEAGVAVMKTQARSSKKIQMEFSGIPGEEFSIKLAIDEFSVIEPFRI